MYHIQDNTLIILIGEEKYTKMENRTKIFTISILLINIIIGLIIIFREEKAFISETYVLNDKYPELTITDVIQDTIYDCFIFQGVNFIELKNFKKLRFSDKGYNFTKKQAEKIRSKDFIFFKKMNSDTIYITNTNDTIVLILNLH